MMRGMNTRKPRPHPARRSRRAAGAVSIGATALLVGGMAVSAHQTSTKRTSANTTKTATQGTTATTTPTTASTDESDDSQLTTPAQSGTVTQQPITSSNAS
jgi:hypothetical protein